MTLKELAAKLEITTAALRMQLKRGALHGMKDGRDWFIPDKEAARYIKENAGKFGAASPRHPRTGNRTPRKPKERTDA
jgi:hypothetical protein